MTDKFEALEDIDLDFSDSVIELSHLIGGLCELAGHPAGDVLTKVATYVKAPLDPTKVSAGHFLSRL